MNEIDQKLNKIASLEQKIEREEKAILELENDLLAQLNRQPRIALFKGPKNRKAKYLHALILRKLMRIRVIYSLLVVSGVVLVWRGVWDLADATPILKIPAVSLLVGLSILWLTQRSADGRD